MTSLTWIAALVLFTLGAELYSAENQKSGFATEARFELDIPNGAPFPSDWLTTRDNTNTTHRRVSLQLPDCQLRVSDCEDLTVINELDGFNLLPRLSIPFSGPIDPDTVTSNTVFLVSLGIIGPGQDYMPWGTVVGINQVVWDPVTNTLHVESDELLAQHTRFALIVTRGVRGRDGTPIDASDAFLRFRATIREDYKQALLDAIQASNQVGVREDEIAVASVFTTQSATAVLEKIRDQILVETPDPADFLLGPNGERTVFNLDQVTDITWIKQTLVDYPFFDPASVSLDLSLIRSIFPGTVGSIAFGKYISPDYLFHPGEFIPPVGTRNGTPVVRGFSPIYFNLFLPSGPKPTNGWPVAIFVHGIGGNKNETALDVVSSMAKYGIATIAIDNVGHGFGDQSALTVNRTVGDPITFPTGGRGIDQDGNGKIDRSEGFSAARPRAVVLFSDGYRQTAVDLMQLVRVIEVGMDVDGDGQRDLDSSRIYSFSHSLGGGISTVFVAVEPKVQVGVFSAPFDPAGAALSCVWRNAAGATLLFRQPSLLNSPGIKLLDGCTVSAPRFNENFPLRDQIPLTVQLTNGTTKVIQSPVTNTVAGAMAIQEAVENLKWVGQVGSPLAYAPHLRKAPLDGIPPKSVLFLTAKGDQGASNPSTTAMVRAGDLADRTLYYRHDLYYESLFPILLTKNPHGFAKSLDDPLLLPISLGVQDMVGKFFQSDGVFLAVPEPSQFFEFPIAGPLPEELNYIP